MSKSPGTALPEHLHVVGICGVATSAIAIAFSKRGVRVTGSDKGFFPPVSTELAKHGISFHAGWHPEKMLDHGEPDLIMAGGSGTSPSNPEIVWAKERGIPVHSYAEIIGAYFVKERSVVCAGTWGKTSSSALLSFILDRAGFDPSYMFGGVSLSHGPSARLTDSAWSVVEGDEYQAAIWNKRAKFFYYKPTHLLLGAVSWDHADMYPSEADYFVAFKKLLEMVPADGSVVACADNEGVMKIVEPFKGKKIFYGRARGLPARAGTSSAMPAYAYKHVSQSKRGLKLTISHGRIDHNVVSPLLGLYQAENITGCFAMACEAGVPPATIIEAISEFKGLKRRMEKRLDGATSDGGVAVIDDIAHSPEKALSVLNTLKSICDGRIIAVFEPNSGGRERESAAKYDNAFRDADIVVIPRLSALKVAEDRSDQPLRGDELAAVIGKTHAHARYIEDDAALIDFLVSTAKKGDVIAFLGSHGFRGMIEELVKEIS